MRVPDDGFPESWWNDQYGEGDGVVWDTGDPQPAIVERAESGDLSGRVLDVGCGLGTEACYLAGRGHRVVGVDASSVAVERARDRTVDRSLDGSVSFRVADALALPEAGLGTFETAIDCGLLHALPPGNRAAYADSLASVLEPGGTAVFVEFGPGAPEDWPPHTLSGADVREALGDRFRIDAVEDCVFETRRQAVTGIDVLATATER